MIEYTFLIIHKINQINIQYPTFKIRY